MRGIFITFEGIEGSGKSTQIRMLEEYLHGKGHRTVSTREPGGTAIGDRIRKVLLSPDHAHMDPVTELMLYEADRCQHVHEVIRPMLDEGNIVLCDRYADATTAYQGAARKIGRETVKVLHTIVTDDLYPDLTLLIDCPVDWGLKHAKRRNRELELEGTEDRFEREEHTFHERVRLAYLDIAKREPERMKVIDGARSIEEVHEDVIDIVCGILS